MSSSSLRVLCIHGNGDHPEHFRRQVTLLDEQLRQFAGSVVEFDYFVMEDIPASIPWDVLKDHVQDSPHWTPFHASSASAVKKSVAALFEHVLAYGPYHGVLAFSMGTALASTAVMLHDQILSEMANQHFPLFGFALFICGLAPQFATTVPIYNEENRSNHAILKDAVKQTAENVASQILRDIEEPAGKDGDSHVAQHDCNGSEVPATGALKIDLHGISLDTRSLQRMQSVHVMGGLEDSLLPASLALFKMSNGMSRASYLEHHEGHQMPEGVTRLRKIAWTLLGAMYEALKDVEAHQLHGSDIQRQKRWCLYNWCKKVRDPEGMKMDRYLPSTWKIIEERLQIQHPNGIADKENWQDVKEERSQSPPSQCDSGKSFTEGN